MAEVLSGQEKLDDDLKFTDANRNKMSDGSDSDVPVKRKRAATRRRARPVFNNTKPVCSIYKVSENLFSRSKPLVPSTQLIDSDEDDDSDVIPEKKRKKGAKSKKTKDLRIALSSDEDDLELVSITTPAKNNDSSHDTSRDSPSPPPTLPMYNIIQPVRNRKNMKVLRNVDKALDSLHQYKSQFQSPSSALDDSLIVMSPSVEEKTMKVKVRCKYGLQRYDLKMHDQFGVVMKSLSDMFRVPVNRINLTLKNDSVLESDTPKSLNLHIADFIECIVLEPSATAQDILEEQGKGCIEIKVQGGKGAKTKKTISIKRTDPLERLMDNYAKLIDVPRKKIAFYFDGDRISPNDTPDDIDIDDDDVIDAVVTR